MFEDLMKRFSSIFEELGKKKKLTKKEVEETLREIRRALLEADVNLKVVKAIISSLKEELIGQASEEMLTPSQTIIKLTRDKLVEIMGGEAKPFTISKTPSLAFLVGLQGSGKTTTAAKLAYWWHKNGRRPILVAADFRRPAAIDQLRKLAERISVPFVVGNDSFDSVRRGLEKAKEEGHDLVIVDTAGRVHIDEEMMDEIKALGDRFRDSLEHVLLVLDAMTGQEAVNTAKAFDEVIPLTGFILTKLDGDARGGAALSITYVLGKPIYFIGVGERVEALEVFHPDRIVSRILGMGDVLTFIEKVTEQVKEEELKDVERYLKGRFTMNDYLKHLKMLRRMGGIRDILGMLPLKLFGIDPSMLEHAKFDERQLKRIEAIINSMTPLEREDPDIIDGSRKARIARGSGTSIRDVNKVLKHYREIRKMLKKLGGLTKQVDMEAIERNLAMLEKMGNIGSKLGNLSKLLPGSKDKRK